MMELYLHSTIYLHGIVLTKLSTGTTLPFLPEFQILLINFRHYIIVFLIGCMIFRSFFRSSKKNNNFKSGSTFL
jgi:hypothetical protein